MNVKNHANSLKITLKNPEKTEIVVRVGIPNKNYWTEDTNDYIWIKSWNVKKRLKFNWRRKKNYKIAKIYFTGPID